MPRTCFLRIGAFAVCGAALAISIFPLRAMDQSWIDPVKDGHDVTLPAWGPYSKRYAGISHVTSSNDGLRFDVSVFPGLYRRKTNPPNALFESGFHPWEAATDLSYFSYRHEVEWKDQVYADISYSKIDEQSRLIRAECVNATALPQNLELHFVASMNFPDVTPTKLVLPHGAIWVDAIDYQDMRYAKSRHSDRLVVSGRMRGEIRSSGFVGGSGLGTGFGSTKGDTVSYAFEIPEAIADARLVVRYRMKAGEQTAFASEGLTDQTLSFTGDAKLSSQVFELGNLSAGAYSLKLTATGGSAIDLDGFAILPASALDGLDFQPVVWNPHPERIDGPEPNSIVLKYENTDVYYGLRWEFSPSRIREFIGRDLDVIFPLMIQNHVDSVFRSTGEGHFTDVFLRPIVLAPTSKCIVHAFVCNGSREEVMEMLSAADMTLEKNEAKHASARSSLPDLQPTDSGQPYQFSQERMAATLLTNVVFPVYTQRSYIRHNAPGKWWDSLYTWDSGFIGLGLLEVDNRRAFECLNAYLTEEGAQSVFIRYGSMVPVQFYLFHELWNRTQSQELLAYAYPRLRQYYQFFIGSDFGSTMGKFQSGLLTPFDYFYNSGGWDDYPPQKHLQATRKASRTAPVVTNAHAIRLAKIMSLAAEALGKSGDVAGYQRDIDGLASALQKHSWDEDSGYFGYVEHDANGLPIGIMKTEDSVNYNMGMDGVYPLVAGIGSDAQTRVMLEQLKSPERLWSRIGLTAVDQSAPYYKPDGYWNGTVWMPHQWFFWKTMLDLGEGDFAWEIAKRALELWKNEVNASYNCMEHFIIETGRGAGWHQFGALSSPVLKWYAAYHLPGTLSTGFNVWMEKQHANEAHTEMLAEIRVQPSGRNNHIFNVVACMNPEFSYSVLWNGSPAETKILDKGLLQISLPAGDAKGQLRITTTKN